ncbi:MAG: SUMF1/EgtB/PvdO family nonheme iron enzyme [Candidatus Cloacimonetes bacterium]|nr:SUMF1/EgtB/PvdO family nonheme iron enzyme [Candidatus Cloacimonadota bacterium]
MKKTNFFISVFMLLALVLMAFSCNKKPTEPEDQILDPIVAEETVVIPSDVVNNIIEVTDGHIVFPSDVDPSYYQVGKILVSEPSTAAPNGFLRKVLSHTTNRNQIVVHTEQARLEDAFEQLHLNITEELKTSDISSTQALIKGITFTQDAKTPDFFNYRFSEDINLDNNVVLTVDGVLNLSLGFAIEAKINRANGLHYLLSRSSIRSSGGVDIDVNGGFECVTSIELIRHNFAPRSYLIPSASPSQPPVPIVIATQMTIFLDIDANGEARAIAGLATTASVSSSLIYEKPNWSNTQTGRLIHTHLMPDIGGPMNVTVGAGPLFEINFFGAPGPFADTRKWMNYDADTANDPWWTLRGGCYLDSGVRFDALGYQADHTVEKIVDLDEIVIQADEYQVATPTFDPPGGSYPGAQYVSISCATSGATIYYTTNGSTPTHYSTEYTEPVLVAQDATLQAKAYKTGLAPSLISNAAYSITDTWIVAIPTFSPPGGTYTTSLNVTIGCATSGATIRYTTNGQEPTAASSLYSAPIAISHNTTLKAKAFKTNWMPSSTGSADYTINITTPGQMVYVQGGTYTMGDTHGFDGQYAPPHTITVDSFSIGKYLVMQSEFEAIMGSNPSQGHGIGDSNPVYSVSWFKAIKYCNLRSMDEGLTPVYTIAGTTNPLYWGEEPTINDPVWCAAICDWDANGYRLPTEAEWEYAARGGTDTYDFLYSGSDDLDAVSWHSGNSGGTTHVVGSKLPNGLGIYDMSGNLFEWCWDWLDSYYYNYSPTHNPRGPASGEYRIGRGGSWHYEDYYHRVACRMSHRPGNIYPDYGFRVCRSAN